MMTEEEARKKICKRVPVCTQIDTNGQGDERRFYEEMIIFCIASDCAMGWRWKLITAPGKNQRELLASYSTTEGYCGLGGKL